MRATGKKVTIRPPEKEDHQDIQKHARDKEIAHFTRVPHPYNSKHAEQFIKDSKEKWKKGTGYTFVVIENKHQKLVGTISLKGINTEKKTVEIGYWIGKEHWKKGYASDALETIEKFAKKKNITNIFAYVIPDNTASLKLLTKHSYQKQKTVQRNEKCSNQKTILLTKNLILNRLEYL